MFFQNRIYHKPPSSTIKQGDPITDTTTSRKIRIEINKPSSTIKQEAMGREKGSLEPTINRPHGKGKRSLDADGGKQAVACHRSSWVRDQRHRHLPSAPVRNP